MAKFHAKHISYAEVEEAVKSWWGLKIESLSIDSVQSTLSMRSMLQLEGSVPQEIFEN